MKTKTKHIILIAVFLAAALIRFWNFPFRVTFWSEQAQTLITSADYLTKPSLLGQEYFRHDSSGHVIFAGAFFNYTLVPLLLILNFDPVKITVFFTLLNLLTGFLIYYLVNKFFGFRIAIFSAILFLFNDFMIYHSLFIWIYNYLIPIGALIAYFFYQNLRKTRAIYFLILGLFSGIGVGLQVPFWALAFLILIINLYKSENKIRDFLLFGLGMVIAEFPAVIFDLKHNFYQVKTIWNYFTETLRGKSDATFNYYYFLAFWPALSVFAAWLLNKITKRNFALGLTILSGYVFINLASPRINLYAPTGMPKGIITSDIDHASRIIADDSKGGFNVASVLDFDKRAYVLRYFVQYKYHKIPMGVADYPNSQIVYTLAQKDFDFINSGIWEIKSGGLDKISLLTNVGGGYGIYKLSK